MFCGLFFGSQSIFHSGAVKVGLKLAACIVGDDVAVIWLFLGLVFSRHCLQDGGEPERTGKTGFPLSGTVVFSFYFWNPGNNLNRIHFEIKKSICCNNPSLAAYFNSVLFWFCMFLLFISAEQEENFTFFAASWTHILSTPPLLHCSGG